jgi:hypothetical protein
VCSKGDYDDETALSLMTRCTASATNHQHMSRATEPPYESEQTAIRLDTEERRKNGTMSR